MKFLFLILFLPSFSLTQEELQNSLEEENRLEVQDRFPRFRVQYPFEKVAQEVENEIKNQETSSEEKKSK